MKLLLRNKTSFSQVLMVSMDIEGLVLLTLTYTFDMIGMSGFMYEVMSQRNTCRLVYWPAMEPSVTRKSSLWQRYVWLALLSVVSGVNWTVSGTFSRLLIPSMPELLLYHL